MPDSHLIIFPAFNIGYSELFYFLKSLADNGLLDRVLLICSGDFFSAFQIQVRYCITDEFNSFPALVKKIASWGKKHRLSFKGIIAIDEELHFQLSKKIAGHFGLEFYNDTTCLLASNKFLLKTSFREKNVPTGAFTLLSSLDPRLIDHVGFPNVLKVLSGTQSQYIFYNENPEELKTHFHRLKNAVKEVNGDPRFKKQGIVFQGQHLALNPKRQFLLEAYAPGEEYSCDFIIQSNDIQLIRVVKKITGPYFGYFKGYHLLNEEGLIQNNIDRANLIVVCRGIALALAIDTGLCMVDFKSSGGQITVLEASIRPGLSAFNHLMYAIYGYTSLALMAMQKMGIKISVRIPDSGGAVVYLYTLKKGIGRSFAASELEKLKDRFDIIAVHKYEETPDTALDPDLDHSGLLWGYVLVKIHNKENPGESIHLIAEKMQYPVKEPG